MSRLSIIVAMARNRVIAALQKKHPGLNVSFTLPALPRGITADGLALLRNAKGHGVDIGAVNAMAMNFGSSPAPHPRGRMGKYAIDTAEATQALIDAGVHAIKVGRQIGQQIGAKHLAADNV